MKNQLLQDAASAPYCKNQRVLNLAAASLSASEISERQEVLARRISRVKKAFQGVRYLTFFGVAAAFFILTREQIAKPEFSPATNIFFSVLFALLTGAFSLLPLLLIQSSIHHLWASTDEQELLKPIAGTIQCTSAWQDIERGGSGVAQWRDLAIAERGQLHQFDADMLSVLHGVYLNRTMREAHQAEVELACRKVHGIVDIPAETPLPPITRKS